MLKKIILMVALAVGAFANISTATIFPLENIALEESKKEIGHIEIMRENLAELKGATDCK